MDFEKINATDFDFLLSIKVSLLMCIFYKSSKTSDYIAMFF